MQKQLLFLLISIVFFACNSSQKSLQKGNYDKAIKQSIKKLSKKPNDASALQTLDMAYNKSVEQDKRKINLLKQEGRPENWGQIYDLYAKMVSRQDRIRVLNNIPSGIQFTDYTADMLNAKEKAAEFYYTNAKQLLGKGGRENARKAYDEFTRAKQIYPNFKDVDDQLNNALEQGTSYVVFEMKNQTGVPLPPQFERELTKISLTNLNKKWIKYHSTPQSEVVYNYTILVNMKVIDVSPERDVEKHYTETAKVRDGWEYELDDKGNVKKDSLGNDIKHPKYVEIKCDVVEKQRNKQAIISGTLDYIDNSSKELLKTDPIKAESFWQNRSCLANGNKKALKPATLKLVGVPPAVFPSDFELLLDAGQTLKTMTKEIIDRNKNVLY